MQLYNSDNSHRLYNYVEVLMCLGGQRSKQCLMVVGSNVVALLIFIGHLYTHTNCPCGIMCGHSN